MHSDLISLKTCNKCRVEKPISDYYMIGPKGKKYPNYICKPCTIAYARGRYGIPEVRHRTKDVHWKRRYGITRERYETMLREQGGVCAICKNPETGISPRTGTIRLLTVDHCHSTGAIRGLLCNSCNRAIGLLKDCPDILKNALSYLEESRV